MNTQSTTTQPKTKRRGSFMSLFEDRWNRTREESIAALRRQLQTLRTSDLDCDESQPKMMFIWCTPRRSATKSTIERSIACLCEGCSVAILLDDGRVIVADILLDVGDSPSLIVHVWGRPRGSMTRIPRSRIASSVLSLGEHTRAEEQFVCRRQREGDWLTYGELRRLGGLDAST